jgi:PadR family transcriptional regulator PadR
LVPVTLVLLKEESSHGYEIMGRLEEQFGFEEINPGSVYRTLRQMENEGLCCAEWETSDSGPARRMYFITDTGEAYLEAWAKACEHYGRLMDTFSQIYTNRTPRSSE